jgi:HEAT repeat protein
LKKKALLTTALVFTALFMWQSAGAPVIAASANPSGKTLYDYGESRDPAGVEVLLAALDHSDRHMRRIAARALGKIGDDSTVQPLIEVLLSPQEDPAVRAVAAWALGAMNAGQAVQPLYCCLDSGDRDVRHQASNALRTIATHYVRLVTTN